MKSVPGVGSGKTSGPGTGDGTMGAQPCVGPEVADTRWVVIVSSRKQTQQLTVKGRTQTTSSITEVNKSVNI